MSPRLKEHHIKRGIAVLCAAAFLAQDMAWAAPQVRIMPTPAPSAAEVASSMVRFRLPDSVGLIDDAWKAPADADGKDRLVVLVQDAHTNPSGQINLSRALGSILAAEPVGTVYTEGAQGDVSLRFLRDRVSEAELRTVLMAYLKKGIVKGDDYWNAVAPDDFGLWGVEDMDLYRRSLEVYQKTVKLRPEVRAYLDRMLRSAQALEDVIYPFEMRRLETLRRQRRGGTISESDYFKQLLASARAAGMDLARDAQVRLFEKFSRTESSLDTEALDHEQRSALAGLSTEDQEELMPALEASRRQPQDLAGSRAFGFALRDKLGVDVERFPSLKKYFDHLNDLTRLEPLQLLDEMDALERDLSDAAGATEDAVRLRETVRGLERLSDLIDLKITPDDFFKTEQVRAYSDLRYLSGWINAKLEAFSKRPELAVFLDTTAFEGLRSAREFYRLTRERDQEMLDRMTERMTERNESRSVLIIGGFHAPGLKARLRERGISYVSVLPQVLYETDSIRYEKLLLAQLHFDAKTGARPATRLAFAPTAGSGDDGSDRDARTTARLGAPLLGPEGPHLAAALGDESLVPEAVRRNHAEEPSAVSERFGARMAKQPTAASIRVNELVGPDPRLKRHRGRRTVGQTLEYLNGEYEKYLTFAIAASGDDRRSMERAYKTFEKHRRRIVRQLRQMGLEAMAPAVSAKRSKNSSYRGDHRVALLAFTRALEMRPLTKSLLQKTAAGSAYVPSGDIYPDLPETADDESADLETLRENAYKGYISTTPIGTIAAEQIVYDLQIGHHNLLEGRVETISGRPMDPSMGEIAFALHRLIFDPAYQNDPRIHYGIKRTAAKWLAQFYGVSIHVGKPQGGLDPRGGLSPMYRTVEALRNAESVDDYERISEDLMAYFWFDPARPEAGLEGHSAKAAEHLAQCYRGLASKLEQLHIADSIDLEMQRANPERARLTQALEKASSYEDAWKTFRIGSMDDWSGGFAGAEVSAFEMEQSVRLELSAGGVGDLSGNAVMRPDHYNIFNAPVDLTRADGTIGPNVRVFGRTVARASDDEPLIVLESVDRGMKKSIYRAEDILNKSNLDLILRAMVSSGIFPEKLLRLAVEEGRSEEVVRNIVEAIAGKGRALHLQYYVDNIEANSGLAVSSAIAVATGLLFRRLTHGDLSGRRTYRSDIYEVQLAAADASYADDEFMEVEVLPDGADGAAPFRFKLRPADGKVSFKMPEGSLQSNKRYNVRQRRVSSRMVRDGSVPDNIWTAAGVIVTDEKGVPQRKADPNLSVRTAEESWERLDTRQAANDEMTTDALTGWKLGTQSGTQDGATVEPGASAIFGGLPLSGRTRDGRSIKYPGGVLPRIMKIPFTPEAVRSIERGVFPIRVGLTDDAQNSLGSFDLSHALNEASDAVVAWGKITLEMIRAAARGNIRELGRLAQASVALRQRIGAVSINPLVLDGLNELSRKWGALGVSYGITGARSTGSVLIFIPEDVGSETREAVLRDAVAMISASIARRGKLTPVEDVPKVYRGLRITRTGSKFRRLDAAQTPSWDENVQALRISNQSERIKMRRDLALMGSGENPDLVEDDLPAEGMTPEPWAAEFASVEGLLSAQGRTETKAYLNTVINDPDRRQALFTEAADAWLKTMSGTELSADDRFLADHLMERSSSKGRETLHARRAARILLQKIWPQIRSDRSFETWDALVSVGVTPGQPSDLERIPGVLSIAPDLLAIIREKSPTLHQQILDGDPDIELHLEQLEAWKEEAINRALDPYPTGQNYLTARFVRQTLEKNLDEMRTLNTAERLDALELVRSGVLDLQYPYSAGEMRDLVGLRVNAGDPVQESARLLGDGRKARTNKQIAKQARAYAKLNPDEGFVTSAFKAALAAERAELMDLPGPLTPEDRVRLDFLIVAPSPEDLDLEGLEFAVQMSRAYREHFGERVRLLRQSVPKGSVIGWTAAGGVGGRYGGGNVVKPVMPFPNGMESDATFLGLMLRRWAAFFGQFKNEDGEAAIPAPGVGILVSVFTRDAVTSALERLRQEAGGVPAATVETGVQAVALPTRAEAVLSHAEQPKGNAQREAENLRQLRWLIERIEEELAKEPGKVRTTFKNTGLNPLNGYAPKGTASNFEGLIAENNALFTEEALRASGMPINEANMRLVPEDERRMGMPLAKAALCVEGDAMSLVWLLQSSSVAPLSPIHLADALYRLKQDKGFAVWQYTPGAGGVESGGVVFRDRKTKKPVILEGSLFKYGERSVHNGMHTAMTTGNMFFNAKRLHQLVMTRYIDRSETLRSNRPDLPALTGFGSEEDFLQSTVRQRRAVMDGWMQRAVTAYQTRSRLEQLAGSTHSYLINQAERPMTVNLKVLAEMFDDPQNGVAAVTLQQIDPQLFADPKDAETLARFLQDPRYAGAAGYRLRVPDEPVNEDGVDAQNARRTQEEWDRIEHEHAVWIRPKETPDSRQKINAALERQALVTELMDQYRSLEDLDPSGLEEDVRAERMRRLGDLIRRNRALAAGSDRADRRAKTFLDREATALFERLADAEIRQKAVGWIPAVRAAAHRLLGVYDKDGTIEDPARPLTRSRAKAILNALVKGQTQVILTGSTAQEAWEHVMIPLIREAERRNDLPDFIKAIALSRITVRANDATSIVAIETGIAGGEWRSPDFVYAPKRHEHGRVGGDPIPTLEGAEGSADDQRISAVQTVFKAYLRSYLLSNWVRKMLGDRDAENAAQYLDGLSLDPEAFRSLTDLPPSAWLTDYHTGGILLRLFLESAGKSGDRRHPGAAVLRGLLEAVPTGFHKLDRTGPEAGKTDADFTTTELVALGIAMAGVKDSAYSYLSLTADALDHVRQTDTRPQIHELAAAIFSKGLWSQIQENIDSGLHKLHLISKDGREVLHTVRAGEGYANIPFGGLSKVRVLDDVLRAPRYAGWTVHISGDSKTDQGKVPDDPTVYPDRGVLRVFLGERTEMNDTELAHLTNAGMVLTEYGRSAPDPRGDRRSGISRPGPAMFYDILSALLRGLESEDNPDNYLPTGSRVLESSWKLARMVQRGLNRMDAEGTLVLSPAALTAADPHTIDPAVDSPLAAARLASSSQWLQGWDKADHAARRLAEAVGLKDAEVVSTPEQNGFGAYRVRIKGTLDHEKPMPEGFEILRELFTDEALRPAEDPEFYVPVNENGMPIGIFPVPPSEARLVASHSSGSPYMHLDLTPYFVRTGTLRQLGSTTMRNDLREDFDAVDRYGEQLQSFKFRYDQELFRLGLISAMNKGSSSIGFGQPSYVYVRMDRSNGDLMPVTLNSGTDMEHEVLGAMFKPSEEPRAILAIYPTTYPFNWHSEADRIFRRQVFADVSEAAGNLLHDGSVLGDAATGSGVSYWAAQAAARLQGIQLKGWATDINPLAVANADYNLREVLGLDVVVRQRDGFDTGARPWFYPQPAQILISNSPAYPYNRDFAARPAVETMSDMYDAGRSAVGFWNSLTEALKRTDIIAERARLTLWNHSWYLPADDEVVKGFEAAGSTVTVVRTDNQNHDSRDNVVYRVTRGASGSRLTAAVLGPEPISALEVFFDASMRDQGRTRARAAYQEPGKRLRLYDLSRNGGTLRAQEGTRLISGSSHAHTLTGTRSTLRGADVHDPMAPLRIKRKLDGDADTITRGLTGQLPMAVRVPVTDIFDAELSASELRAAAEYLQNELLQVGAPGGAPYAQRTTFYFDPDDLAALEDAHRPGASDAVRVLRRAARDHASQFVIGVPKGDELVIRWTSGTESQIGTPRDAQSPRSITVAIGRISRSSLPSFRLGVAVPYACVTGTVGVDRWSEFFGLTAAPDALDVILPVFEGFDVKNGSDVLLRALQGVQPFTPQQHLKQIGVSVGARLTEVLRTLMAVASAA